MINRIKSSYVLIIITMLTLVLAACGSDSSSASDNNDTNNSLSFGGASPGGAAYQLSTAYAEIINSELDNVSVSVEVTGGGQDNVSLIHNGDLASGHGNSGVGYEAYNGIGEFEGNPHTNIMGWLPLYNYPFQIVVLEDSPIQTVSDLVDKKIGVNVKGSGGEKTSDEVFTALGLERDEDYEPYYLDYDEAVDALTTGRLDATIFSTGAPTPSLIELATTTDFRIIGMTEEEMETVADQYSYLTAGTLEAGTYDNITENVQTIHASTINYISKDLSEDIVYDMTKAIWENRDRLIVAHPSQEGLNGELIESATLPIMPLHPGAEKYFKEEGIID